MDQTLIHVDLPAEVVRHTPPLQNLNKRTYECVREADDNKQSIFERNNTEYLQGKGILVPETCIVVPIDLTVDQKTILERTSAPHVILAKIEDIEDSHMGKT